MKSWWKTFILATCSSVGGPKVSWPDYLCGRWNWVILEQMKNSSLGAPWIMNIRERLGKSEVQMPSIKDYSKGSYIIRIISQWSTLRKKKYYGPWTADNPQIIHFWLWNKYVCVCVHPHMCIHVCNTNTHFPYSTLV